MNVVKKRGRAIGIDVSKDTFNACFKKGDDRKYGNSRKGWRKLAKEAPANAIFAMEATGNYYYRLACFLKSKGFQVLVFNPLWVKRYMQSLGSKVKTDKKDAELIGRYANSPEAKCQVFEPLPPKLARAKVVSMLLARLAKTERSVGNVSHAVSLVIDDGDDLHDAMRNVSEQCRLQMEALEKELCRLADELWPDKFRLLQTIPGFGAKTAAVMLVSTKGMEFGASRQLASFAGLAPSVYESGTSVRARGRIRKTGNSYLRKLLYMCTMSAVRFCKPCGDLYNRLQAKGKSKLLSRTAVMHRLVKIAYGVVNSGEAYRGGKLAVEAA